MKKIKTHIVSVEVVGGLVLTGARSWRENSILLDFLHDQKAILSQLSAGAPFPLLPARALHFTHFLICMYFLAPILLPIYCFLYF